MIDHSKQHIFIIRFSQVTVSVLPAAPAPRDEGGHVYDLGEVHPGADLLVESTGVLEPLQMK